MSCMHCNVKFGFFNKESGCTNCGRSFCNKCLKQRFKLPGKEKETQVCSTCYTNLSRGITVNNEGNRPPPEAFLKRLAALDSTASTSTSNKKVENLKNNLSSTDKELINRLEKLKCDMHKEKLPSEDELRKRLDNLKGETKKSAIVYDPTAIDLRSDQEKIDSLLEEYMNETQIERKSDSIKLLEERIAKLKGEKPQAERQNYEQVDEMENSSEEESEKVVNKVMSEVALNSKRDIPSSKKDDIVQFEEDLEKNEPELPWCVLCNADAHFRCLDCGGDLYCSRCVREVHKQFGEEDHNIIAYKKQ